MKSLLFSMSLAAFLSGCGGRSRSDASPSRGTVVCVHGLMKSRANTWALASSLHADGWRTLNWKYASRSKRIEAHAADLVETLKEISAERPGEPISFATFSLGGLVVRAALNLPDCPAEARCGRAVLLAPPNRGAAMARRLQASFLARWFFGPASGRELMETPQDGFDQLGQFPGSCQVLVLAGDAGFNPWIPGPDDGKVGVEETRLRTPHAFQKVHAGHSWISWSPRVIRATKVFLREHS